MDSENKEKYGYIYITENLISGKKYIGQHKAKKFEPDKYIGSGTLFKKVVNMYGFNNFKCSLIEWCYSPEELNSREIYWISYYNAYSSSDFYNLTKGGEGPLGMVYSEETRKKKSNSMKGKTNKPIICIETQISYNSIFEAASILNISAASIGQACRGKSEFGCGYHWAYLNDIETQNKYKNFIGLPQQNYHKRSSRPVICIELGKIFPSIRAAQKWLGKGSIADCMNGSSNGAGGYHWCYEDKLNNYTMQEITYKGNRKIICVETGEVFESIKEATLKIGLTSIPSAVSGHSKTAGGLHWKYYDD